MALAKKKAPVKKPVTKTKTPAAKASSKPKVSRRPKVSAEDVLKAAESQADLAGIGNSEVKSTQAETSQDHCCDHPKPRLEDIKALDVSDMAPLDRLMVIQGLKAMGFLSDDGTPLLAYLGHESSIQYIGLNHRNRLLSRMTVEQFQACPATSRVRISVDVDMEFSHPEPFHPETISQGEALYIRVR